MFSADSVHNAFMNSVRKERMAFEKAAAGAPDYKVCVRGCVCVRARARLCVCVCARARACVHVCMCACVCVVRKVAVL